MLVMDGPALHALFETHSNRMAAEIRFAMSTLNKRCVPSSSETGNVLPKVSTSVERSVNKSVGDLVKKSHLPYD